MDWMDRGPHFLNKASLLTRRFHDGPRQIALAQCGGVDSMAA
jgi:hypothetical protein